MLKIKIVLKYCFAKYVLLQLSVFHPWPHPGEPTADAHLQVLLLRARDITKPTLLPYSYGIPPYPVPMMHPLPPGHAPFIQSHASLPLMGPKQPPGLRRAGSINAKIFNAEARCSDMKCIFQQVSLGSVCPTMYNAIQRAKT